jgi:hypothetical protein
MCKKITRDELKDFVKKSGINAQISEGYDEQNEE